MCDERRKLYMVWYYTIQHCHNPGSRNFAKYGGKCIRVCDRWRNSFGDFLADMGPRPPRAVLYRENPNEGFTPDNCRWGTHGEDTNTKRSPINCWKTCNLSVNQIRKLKASGLSYGIIAKQAGVTRQRIQKMLRPSVTLDVCSTCGSSERLHFHHDNYLTDAGRALCIYCHLKEHSS